jgi:ATP synthase protein I
VKLTHIFEGNRAVGGKGKLRSKLNQLRMVSLGSNFATAPIVGGALGYGIDWLIGTYPWGMVGGIALGFVSAFIEILRHAR